MDSLGGKQSQESGGSNRDGQNKAEEKGQADSKTHPSIPSGDLTIDRLHEFLSLSDREKICWALQTETRVRLNKVNSRGAYDSSLSKVINDGGYLFDIYPPCEDDPSEAEETFGRKRQRDPSNIIKKDEAAFSRKRRSFLSEHRELDGSWAGVTPIDISGYERYNNCLRSDSESPSSRKNRTYRLAPCPPNFLFFQIVLEGYMGYKAPSFHSSNSHFPRGAVMGGAVLAALTSWRQPRIVRIFEEVTIENFFNSNEKRYKKKRDSLVKQINDFFIYESFRDPAVFSDGDVDIFLQASPLSRGLMKQFTAFGIHEPNILNIINGFIGGVGFCQSDLSLVAKQIYNNTLSDMEEAAGLYKGMSGFAFALTQNGLSFELGLENIDHYESWESDEGQNGIEVWPRVTQMIMLKPDADLLGGLLDFDISAVACAYDGNNVYVTPRASLSLVTLSQVVTPFVMAEERNRGRIIKYWKRGFAPYLVDPNCNHEQQCQINNDMSRLKRGKSAAFGKEVNIEDRFGPETPMFKGRPLLQNQHEEYENVLLFQEENPDNIFFCCAEPGKRQRCGKGLYSVALFPEPDDVLCFLSKLNKWTEDWRRQVNLVDPRGRVICAPCSQQYSMDKVISAGLDDKIWRSGDNCLHDELSCNGWNKFENKDDNHRYNCGFDFYCGPTLDARSARSGLNLPKLLAKLKAKAYMERMRFIVEHGYDYNQRYLPRFIFGDDLSELFSDASKVEFAAPSRNPVGLNPERFIAKCQSCTNWMENCEYGVRLCELCQK